MPDSVDPASNAFKAVARGDMARLDALLGEGLDVNTRTEGDRWNFLHLATVLLSKPADPDVVRHLLEIGVDVNARDGHLWTPLHFAIRTKSRLVVKMLIDAGADVDALNDEGTTPLHLSVIKAHRDLEVTRMLLDAGADPDNEKARTTARGYLSKVAGPDVPAFLELLALYPKR